MGTEPSIKALFSAALERPLAERGAFLDGACAGNEALRLRIDRLLGAHQASPGFLAPAPDSPHSPWAGRACEAPGDTIGDFRLIETIGEGGFGVVFLAEQQSPVVRRVALKIIKAGMDTRQVVARFETERQTLAMMDHPGIARVLDAGATANGRPYFVMELVRGEPITTFCDAARLDLRHRLELFQQVCHAVQHAHQKGIIHRDLKPSNVLVADVDGRPAPKIIDFGIAKATGGAEALLTDATLLTTSRQFLGTPEYMSPEQTGAGAVDIDTRADIYSLGVLLYELLVGQTPFDPGMLRRAGWDEMCRVIRETDAARPSTRLHSMRPSREIAAQRRTEPARLTALLRGDLDWIVMKCLEKDRSRRYETANSLAMEIGRYLAGEPVLAAPPSTAYRIRKFVRRHRVQVVAGVLVAASLLAAVVGTTTFAVRERRRAEETRQVANFQAEMLSGIKVPIMGDHLRDNLLELATEEWKRAGLSDDEIAARRAELAPVSYTTLALRALDRNVFQHALQKIDEEFADQPLLKAELLQRMATAMRELGLLKRAQETQASALSLRERYLAPDHPATLESQYSMGRILARNRPAEAEPFARAALEGRLRVLGPDDPDSLSAKLLMGMVYLWQSRYADAEPYIREVWLARRATLGDDDLDTLEALDRWCQLLVFSGKHKQAEARVVELLECATRLPDGGAMRSSAMGIMGNLRLRQLRTAEAASWLRRSLEWKVQALGEDHRDTLFMGNMLGWALYQLHDLRGATDLFERVYERRRRILGEDDVDTLGVVWAIGVVRRDQGRSQEAESSFRRALEGYRSAYGGHPTNTCLHVAALLADLLDQIGEQDAAAETRLRYVREFLQDYRDSRVAADVQQSGTSIDDVDGSPTARRLAQDTIPSPFYVLLSKVRGGQALQHEFADAQFAVHGVQDARPYNALSLMAWYLCEAGRSEEAEAPARASVEGLQAALAPPDGNLADALDTLARALCDLRRYADALPLFQKARQADRADPGAFGRRSFWMSIRHAECLRELNAFPDAEMVLRECLDGPLTGRGQEEVTKAMITLYEAWDVADPGAAHDSQAAKWRERLGQTIPVASPHK